MLHKFELPFESEILALEDDPALFDADPEWVGDLERTTERRRNRFRAA